MAAAARAWLPLVVFGLLVTSCSTYTVSTQDHRCEPGSCEFQGSDAARAMVARGDTEFGEWHGWLVAVRDELRRKGVASWPVCDGAVATATFTGSGSGEESSNRARSVVMTVARWNGGEIACRGELSIPMSELAVPLSPDPIDEDGLWYRVTFPEEGASFEISV